MGAGDSRSEFAVTIFHVGIPAEHLVLHRGNARDAPAYAAHTPHTMHMRVYFTLRARTKEREPRAGERETGVIRTHKSYLNIPGT